MAASMSAVYFDVRRSLSMGSKTSRHRVVVTWRCVLRTCRSKIPFLSILQLQAVASCGVRPHRQSTRAGIDQEGAPLRDR